jgi:hypothetical protein
MPGRLPQYATGGGVMALLLWLFDQVGSIEDLTPNAELVAKLILGLVVVGAALYLQSRKPPETRKPTPQPRPSKER